MWGHVQRVIGSQMKASENKMKQTTTPTMAQSPLSSNTLQGSTTRISYPEDHIWNCSRGGEPSAQ